LDTGTSQIKFRVQLRDVGLRLRLKTGNSDLQDRCVYLTITLTDFGGSLRSQNGSMRAGPDGESVQDALILPRFPNRLKDM
jgi:hypothetical protein